ncbi:hypothetical protein MSSAC_2195 [Methanosarcina siciliae C2J]|uniref:DUF169 domain-containing protein n=3 Tax=Methanosarcina siciliae TaxID=38027 RepID=A0A0E3PEB8_9EURY|nr:DUF169 domain-containing protein [Methanosarcina siciliae]AKB28550.1 hypothetical protein MSSIT_1831 [Methanosarcina siciliae T4/M]AKB32460.1 hypothetical protein MSSIH_1770 [Methanosarcina siciliae HI350]AKB36785.1 hypothetical protein MSSAC_2195 [Methanosarcina siciliae C2J]
MEKASPRQIEEINEYGKEIIELLKLKTSPVAVALVPEGAEIPEGIKRVKERMKHCQMTDRVRRTKEEFYAVLEDQTCKGGAAAMGLGHMPPKLASGEFYYDKLKHFKTLEASKKTLDRVPMVEAESTVATLYAPLESASFMPDVIVIIGTPEQLMLLTQAALYNEGGRIEAEFAGKQSLCSDAVAEPYLTGKMGITVGCTGSRAYTEIQESELTVGIPAKILKNLVEGLRAIVGKAPAH